MTITHAMGREVVEVAPAKDVAYAPPLPVWTIDFLQQALPAFVTFTRASNASCRDANGTWVSQGSNVARFDFDTATLQAKGLLLETTRTNYLLNSATPATQTVTLSAGTYTLWLEGSGTCACAAGTAAGTGFATASAGSPKTFTISTAGTVVFTVTGSVSRYQCENGAYPTSFISTAGAAATRAADVCRLASLSNVGFNANEGTIVAAFMVTAVDGAVSQRALELSDGTSSNRMILTLSGGSSNFTVTNGGVTQFGTGLGAVNSGVVIKLGGSYKAATFASCKNGGTLNTGATGTVPSVNELRIGCTISGGQTNGWVRGITYFASRLDNGQLQALTA